MITTCQHLEAKQRKKQIKKTEMKSFGDPLPKLIFPKRVWREGEGPIVWATTSANVII